MTRAGKGGVSERFGQSARQEELGTERFRRAFSAMDASDETIERIMAMTEKIDSEQRAQARGNAAPASSAGHAQRAGARRPGKRFTVRAAVATAAVTALVASGAYAAVSSDFFQSAFGTKGQQDVEAHTVVEEDHISPVTGEPVSWTAPSRTWEDVDEQVAQRLLDGYVFDVNRTCELHGYTLTVGQCVMDENGNGVATITIENPDGVDTSDASYGEVYLSNDAPVAFAIDSVDSAVPFWDERIILDAEASTDTKLVGVAYFGPFTGRIDGGLEWVLVDREPGGMSDVAAQDADGASVYKPQATLTTREFRADDGSTVEVSPIALTQFLANSDSSANEAVIRYADGTEYVVYRWGGDEPVSNSLVDYGYSDEAEKLGAAHLFNRLVDVDAIESITLRGHTYVESADGEPGQQDFELVFRAS